LAAIGHSTVKDTGAGSKQFTVTIDKYGDGQGSGTTYIRGSNTIFTQDAGAPAWEEYTVPVWKDWRYVQVKLLG